ncbi:galactoside alpha-(1,2)-fucosyltransferase 2-like [Gigantopelta aegis]|uniref:galactoside alpha-(1,2)-fucosyltransferase 2-like n=1 Tax=Gigantopelta aegis TaxID=1735272 RepID=UPI001B88C30B|nr:galactoside alpha-(1,2)-fucosyltransferase 2-like [Gigantopelta aegis]
MLHKLVKAGLAGILLVGIILILIYTNSESQWMPTPDEEQSGNITKTPTTGIANVSKPSTKRIAHATKPTIARIAKVTKPPIARIARVTKPPIMTRIAKVTKPTMTRIANLTKSPTTRTASVATTQLAKVTKKPKCKHPVLPRFICVETRGRFGNRMFSFAAAYGMATHLNRTMLVDRSTYLNNIFTLDAMMVDKCVCGETKPKHSKKCCSFDKDLLNLKSSENYRVGPFLQSWKYFESVVPQIKKQFTFKREVFDKAREIITKIKTDFLKKHYGINVKLFGENITFVGVHVRRGDVIANKILIRKGFSVAPKQYIDKAMMYFINNFTDVLFLVCSDNMMWTTKNVNHSNVVYVRGNSPEVDMSVLSQCNHTIITVGTFGWWAGFLAGGTTLYYKHPIREGSRLRKQFSDDYSDYFYPGWIGME